MFVQEITPNLAAAQFLPTRQQRRLDRMISRIARRNRPLWAAMQTARSEARADQQLHDEWLCWVMPDTTYDIDIPW